MLAIGFGFGTNRGHGKGVGGTFAPTISLSPDISLAEGNAGTTNFVHTVTRAGDLSGASSVAWAVTATGANPANAADFVGGVLPSGTVSFIAGASSATITIPVAGDATVEPDENFLLTLSSPVGCVISTPTRTDTIGNDDASLPGVFSAPTLTRTGSAGTAPQTYSIAGGADTFEGIWVHLQQATDVGFTTAVADYVFPWLGEEWEVGDQSIGLATISGNSWTRCRFVSVRVLTDPNAVLGNWSNVVNETIGGSVATFSSATNSKSPYEDLSNGNLTIAHNNNVGLPCPAAASIAQVNAIGQMEFTQDAYFNGGGTTLYYGWYDGYSGNAGDTTDCKFAGLLAERARHRTSGAKGFMLTVGASARPALHGLPIIPAATSSVVGAAYVAGEQSPRTTSSMSTYDTRRRRLRSKVYYWDTSAGLAYLAGNHTTDSTVPQKLPRFHRLAWAAGQKGNAGVPSTSDKITMNPDIATAAVHDRRSFQLWVSHVSRAPCCSAARCNRYCAPAGLCRPAAARRRQRRRQHDTHLYPPDVRIGHEPESAVRRVDGHAVARPDAAQHIAERDGLAADRGGSGRSHARRLREVFRRWRHGSGVQVPHAHQLREDQSDRLHPQLGSGGGKPPSRFRRRALRQPLRNLLHAANCPDSSSSGGLLNNSVYWMPTVGLTNPFGDGKNYALRPATVAEYYRNDAQFPHRVAHIPNGLRFVTGRNMDYPNWDNPAYNLAGAIAAANAQPGTAGRYRLIDSNGRTVNDVIWTCQKNTGTSSDVFTQVSTTGNTGSIESGLGAKYLKDTSGNDPWGGQCTGPPRTRES
jgi:hypothetical protein